MQLSRILKRLIMNKKVEIIPAILPITWKEVENGVASIQGMVKSAQIDICDGKFAPNATWPYKKRDDTFEMMIREERGLPGWEGLDYEFDLMVSDPAEIVDDWVTVGATRIIIHAESNGIAEALGRLKDRVEIGLALNIETNINIIEPFKDAIKFVQCMGIRNVGFQGQIFDEAVIAKIREVKCKYPELLISVDGGVSLENAKQLIDAGADRLVVGSAIFDSENPIETLMELKDIACHSRESGNPVY